MSVVPGNTVLIITKINGEVEYGVYKNEMFFIFQKIISKPCNCVTGHNCLELPGDQLKNWSLPGNSYSESLNYIYSEYLI